MRNSFEVELFWPAASDAVARFSLTYSRERWTDTCPVLWLLTIPVIIKNEIMLVDIYIR